MFYLQWYHWASLGILLMASELLVSTFILVWFGVGALVTGITLSIFPYLNLVSQLQIWTLASMAAVLAWVKFIKPLQQKYMRGRAEKGVLGESGTTISEVGPAQSGQVRFQKPVIGNDIWDCIADEVIKAGVKVKVVAVDGNVVKIKPKK